MGCGEVMGGDEPTKTSRKEEVTVDWSGYRSSGSEDVIAGNINDRLNPQRGNCGGRISPIAATWTRFFVAHSEGKSGLRTRYVMAGRETRGNVGHEMGSSCLPCGRE